MTLTNIDWDILMKKLDSLGEKIDRLEKDIQEIKPKYSPYQSDDPNAPYYREPYISYNDILKVL